MKNDYIAAELGVNVRTIYRTKKVLEDEGLITLEKGKIFVKQEQIEQIKVKLYNENLDIRCKRLCMKSITFLF